MTTPRRPLLHSSTVTPPLPEGQELACAAMSLQGIDNLVTLKSTSKFHGIYASGVADCVVVTIIERDATEGISQLHMLHCWGGLGKDRLKLLMDELLKQPSTGGSKEIVITAGNINKNLDAFKASLGYLSGEDINTYLTTNYPTLNFKECKYTFISGVPGSACVTFDGYAGPYYADNRATKTKPDTTKRQDLSVEIEEFERLKIDGRFTNDEVEKMKQAIESASCDDKVKTQLYFYTREVIFKTRFHPEYSNDQKSIEHPDIKAAIEHYKNQLQKLRSFTNKEIIAGTILTIIVGTPSFYDSTPLGFNSPYSRSALLSLYRT